MGDVEAQDTGVVGAESAPAAEPSDGQSVDAALDAAFERATGTQGGASETEPESKTEPVEPVAQPAVQAKKPEPSAAAAPDPTDTPERREALVLAKRALRRDGWSEDLIDTLPAEKVIEVGHKRAKSQSESDRLATRFAEARAERERQKAAQAAGEPAEAWDSETGQPGSDGQRARQPDPVEALLAELEGAGQPGAKPDPARVPVQDPALVQENAALRATLFRTHFQAAERELSSDFPQLKTEAGRLAVVSRMDRLDPDQSAMRGGETEIRDLMRQAAFVEFGQQLIEQSRQAKVTQNQRTRTGQPTFDAGNAPAPRRRPSAEEVLDAAYEAAMTEPDPDGVRRRVSELTGRAP